MIVVATESECRHAEERFPNQSIVVTGVGGLNVIKALSNVDRKSEIINFGFAGSNKLPVGSEHFVSVCKLYHPNVEYDEPSWTLNGDVPCFTSNDFVLSTEISEPCLFDMELAYILALGFENVKSLKIVSDSLNMDEYERTVWNG